MAEDRAPPGPRLGYADLAAGPLRGAAGSLRRRAAELERARAEDEARRAEMDERLESGRRDRPMLPVREWVENEYFVGSLCSTLYDRLKEELVDVFEGGPDGHGYFEVLATGGIGWGKTRLAEVIGLRSLYEVSCYATPQYAFRGMTEHSPIIYLNWNSTQEKARVALYEELSAEVRTIPYFAKEFAPAPNVTKEIRFPKQVRWRTAPTTPRAAVSESVIFGILDEVNEWTVVEDSERAQSAGEVYDVAKLVHGALEQRMRNRYMLAAGLMPRPCKLLTMCSARFADDFTERRVAEAEKVGHPLKVLRLREWDTRPRKMYSLPWFKVAVAPAGSGRRSELVDVADRRVSGDARARLLDARGTELEAQGYQVHDVPGEWRAPFEADLDAHIRQILGVPTDAIEAFIKKRETIGRACELRAQAVATRPLPRALAGHPLTAEHTTLRDGVRWCWDSVAEPGSGGRWRPIVNPRARRYAHFDLSVRRDKTGIAVAHVYDVRKQARTSEHGVQVEEWAPVIWVDLVLQVRPSPDEDVDLAACRQVVLAMAEERGFRFAEFSFDQFQSEEAQQSLVAKGYAARHLSVDRSPEPYVALRRALYEGRLLMYPHSVLTDELLRLEWNGARGKVDHPPKGGKDLADALAAVVYQCETRGMDGAEWAGDPEARRLLTPQRQPDEPPAWWRARRARLPDGVVPADVVQALRGKDAGPSRWDLLRLRDEPEPEGPAPASGMPAGRWGPEGRPPFGPPATMTVRDYKRKR